MRRKIHAAWRKRTEVNGAPLLTEDEARRIASKIAKLPTLLARKE